jgi:ATP-binding cassette subfamily C protein LapB
LLEHDVPPAGEATFDVMLLAERWYGRGPAETPGFGAMAASADALAALAAERGLNLRLRSAEAAAISGDMLPCVVLDGHGRSRILTARTGSGFEAIRAEGAYRIPLDALEPGPLRVITMEGARPEEVVRETPASPDGGEARAVRRSLLRRVMGAMFFGHRGPVALLCLAAILNNLLLLAYPVFSQAVYDRVIPHLALDTLWSLTIGVAIAFVVDFAMRGVRSRLGDSVSSAVSGHLQVQAYARLLRLPLAQAPRTSANLVAGLRELEGMCQVAPSIFVTLCVDLPFLVVIVALVAGTGGLVVLAPLAAGVLIAAAYFAAHGAGEGALRERAGATRAQANLLTETVESLEALKASVAEGQLLRRWVRLCEIAVRTGHESRHWSSVAGQASSTLSQLALVATMVIGVYEVRAGSLSVGGLVFCSILVGRVMAPVVQLVAMLHQVRQATSVLDGVATLLAAPVEEAGDAGRLDDAGAPCALDLRSVSFSYPGADAPSLSDVTLTIRPGEKVALIGRIGSGKSTLLRLLVRLHSPTSGSVLVDGSDVRQVSPQRLRRLIAFMPQGGGLVDDTLRANLCLGHDNVDADRFARAVEIAGVREIASAGQEGYSFVVGPRGDRLSGGERQTVALARVLLGDPRVVVLDEPTAAMDNMLEARVVRDLKPWVGSRTLIVATHRAPVLALVDRIVWLEGGRIIADGPKAEILEKIARAA